MADTLDNASFADLRAALSGEAPKAEETTPAAVEPAVEEKTQEGTEEPAAVEEPKTEEPAPEPVKEPRKPKRFSELTQRMNAAEARAQQLEAELAAARAAKPEPAAVQPTIPDIPNEPKAPDAATWSGTWAELEAARAQYTKDYASWSVKNALNQDRIRREQESAANEAKTVDEAWKAQVDEALESNEYVLDAIKSVGKVLGPKGVVPVVKESPVGVEIVMELETNPDKLAAISKMSIASAAREIGRIEAAILARKESASPAGQKTAAAKLPAPPKEVGGKASGEAKAVDLSDDKLSMGDFKSLARKELGKSRVGLSYRKATVHLG